MVSFWPWTASPSSTASFEKTLSALSTKITNTQSRLDKTRARSRRIKVLWTLYLSFAYLVYAIVMALVVGTHKMKIYEWSAVVGGPVLIYAIRTVIAAFFNFRLETLSSRLKDQQAERAKTIQKLKDATKYDTTLELLEKYGGGEPRPGSSLVVPNANDKTGKTPVNPDSRPGSQQGTPSRTRMPPPPTANIPRRADGSPEFVPQLIDNQSPDAGHVAEHIVEPHLSGVPTSAEFAPNAYSDGHPRPADHYDALQDGPHWYDRILDLLLGEDETAPKNRIVLICKDCRQVNGQAPPGIKTLAEVGSWRCIACHAMNGEMDEGEKIVRQVLESQAKRQERSDSPSSLDGKKVSSEETTLVGEEHSQNKQPSDVRRRKGQAKP